MILNLVDFYCISLQKPNTANIADGCNDKTYLKNLGSRLLAKSNCLFLIPFLAFSENQLFTFKVILQTNTCHQKHKHFGGGKNESH